MPKKPFAKHALSTPDLINFLVGKGLIVNNRDYAFSKINSVGYYRLKIYTRALELPNKHFKAGTTFEDVISLYEFDRNLRLIFLDAIERIEVALRATIINIMCSEGGPHFYCNEVYFQNKSSMHNLMELADRSKHISIVHYSNTYHTPLLAPIWCVTEASAFGDISRLFADLLLPHRKSIAQPFGIDEKILVSWFKSINTLRNICAHHNRLWNGELKVNSPLVAKKYSSDLSENNKLYSRAVIMRLILGNIDEQCYLDWRSRLRDLLSTQNEATLRLMGFPINWLNRPLWI